MVRKRGGTLRKKSARPKNTKAKQANPSRKGQGTSQPRQKPAVLSAEKKQPPAKRGEAKPNRQPKDGLDYATAVFAFVAAIAACAAASFTGWQAWVAEDTALRQLRPYVFLKQAYATRVNDKNDRNKTIAWDFRLVWENSGPTPTQHMVSYRNVKELPGTMPPDFDFPDIVKEGQERRLTKTFVGPHAVKMPSYFTRPVGYLKRIASGPERLYVWGWAEYGDSITKDRRYRSEYCFEIIVDGDLEKGSTQPFTFRSCGRHTGTETECYRRPGDPIPILELK